MPRALTVALLIALAGSVALDALLWTRLRAADVSGAGLAQRLAHLEQLVAAREAADPLMPPECTAFGPGFGDSPDKPCQVEFHRLLEAPQQFAGRWVFVEGRYVSAFETSALVESNQAVALQNADRGLHRERAMWIDGDLPEGEPPREVALVGKFERGPAGHLGQYPGRLTQARVWRAKASPNP